jgi:hypothetical protein
LLPKRIKEIEDRIANRLELKTRLIVRCDIVKDVSSTGSTSAVASENLDGEFITTNLSPKVKRIQLAEQAFLEILEDHPGLYLRDLDLIELEQGPVILATIQSSSAFTSSVVAEFEKTIQERLEDPKVRLLIRSEDLVGLSSKGRILYGGAHFGNLSPEEIFLQKRIEQIVKTEIMRINNMFVPSIDAVKQDDKWFIRAEVVGPKVLSPSQVRAIEKKTTKATGQTVKLYVWSRVELMVTSGEYFSLKNYSEEAAKKRMTRGEVE